MRTSLEPLRANTTCNFYHFFQVLCCRNAAHSCSDSFGEWVVLGSGWCWTATWADGGFWGCLCRETTAELFSFIGLLIHPFVSDKYVWKFVLFLDMSCPLVQHEVRLMFPVVVMGSRQTAFILQLLIRGRTPYDDLHGFHFSSNSISRLSANLCKCETRKCQVITLSRKRNQQQTPYSLMSCRFRRWRSQFVFI